MYADTAALYVSATINRSCWYDDKSHLSETVSLNTGDPLTVPARKKAFCLSPAVRHPQVLFPHHLVILIRPRVGPSSDSVRFHNATSHAEGTNWRPHWFSACSALEGFSLQSQRGILSSTIDLLDGSESGFFFCPVELGDHGKAVLLLKQTLSHTHTHTHKYTLTTHPEPADNP